MRILLIIFFILFTFQIASAKIIEVDEAQEIAEQFFSRQLNNNNEIQLKSTQVFELAYTHFSNKDSLLKSTNKEPSLYIFKDFQNNFVIVSAEDNTESILGYSTENNFSNDMPQALNELLIQYSEQITNIRKSKNFSTEVIKSAWDNPSQINSDENINEFVLPLLSSKWGQTYPYNELCPSDSRGSGGHTLVGCTATAMAQLLYYYKYPNTGNGLISYTDPNYGLIEKNLSESTYNWEQMPKEINTSNQEIAKLMYDCAISIETSFGTNASASSETKVVKALINNFNYSNNLNHVHGGYYTNNAWVNLLKSSLLNSKPIYYTGSGTAGHAFICDGFDNDFFHFNFGWNGNYDGYFLLSSISPDNGSTFNYLHTAIIDVQPIDFELSIDFQTDKRVGFIPFEVNFTNKSNISQEIKKIEWDFDGDGTTDSELENPSYTYEDEGNYEVSLRITTENNSVIETKRSYIKVLEDSSENVIINCLSEDLNWDNLNYYITNDVVVPTNKTLKINSGVKLHFVENCQMIINGSLIAEGSSNNQIEFNSLSSNNYWSGITFNGSQNSILKNCIIENCNNKSFSTIYKIYTFHSAITIYNDNVTVEHCSILNNSCRALEIYASPIISYNLITNNNHSDGAGIMVRGGHPLIKNNAIYKNNGWNGGGALHIRNCSARIINNYLCNNLQGAIKTYNINELIIEGNVICNNFNIWAGGGGGISISGNENSNVVICNNTICNNYAPNGSAMAIYGTKPEIYNNIIWGNAIPCTSHMSSPITLGEGIYPIFNNCIIENLSQEIDVSNNESKYPEDYLINCSGDDPNFINPTLSWNINRDDDIIINSEALNANWNISSKSIAIDNGTTVDLLSSRDIIERRRTWDGNSDGVTKIDIGAFEFNSVYDDTIKFCENSTFLINGKSYTTSGEYCDTLTNSNGEDSIVIYHAVPYINFEIIKDTSICSGDQYQGWTETGTYTQNLQTINGCDSVVTTYLTVNPKFETTEDITICDGSDYKGWTEAGLYTENFTSILGCDSIINTNLSVNEIFQITEEIQICEGNTHLDWAESGEYQRTLKSINGCDSIVTTYLTVNPKFETTENITICEGSDYKGWSVAGQYTENLTSNSGCDSIVNTNLTVNEIFQTTEEIQICEGNTHLDWAKSGEYQRTLKSINGCDSIVTTYLTVNPTFNETEEITICEGEEYNGWNENGNYQRTLSSISGCDSIINTNLWVDKFEETPFITQNVDTLISNFSFGNQWYFNDEIIKSETLQNCILNTSGNYHVLVTNSNGCKETSNIITANKTSIKELNNLAFKIYPNPSKGIITIEFTSEFNGQINVLNTLGQKIYSQQNNQLKTDIDLSGVSTGIYFIEVENDEFSKIRQLIVN